MRDFSEIEQHENGTKNDKIIVIKSVYKQGKHTVQPAWDTAAGWWAGVDRLSDEDKRSKKYFVTVGETRDQARMNTKIVLKDGVVIDLSDPVDALNWKWLKHCKEIAMSFEEAQRSKALFYIHIEGRESKSRNTKSENQFLAMKLVMEDSPLNYENRALLLGMDMSNEHLETVKEMLLDRAKNEPQDILHIYRDKSMKINLLYVKAKQKGKITTNPNDNVIKYGVTILGITDDSAIAFLQDNEDILELLERDVNPDYFVDKKESKALTPLEKAQIAKKEKAKKEEDAKKTDGQGEDTNEG